jgi:hypothetical protein
MAKTKRQREKSSERRASARKWAEKQGTFERTTITVPEGMQIFKFSKKGFKNLNIIEYTVGKGNPDAKPGEKFFCRTFYVHTGIGPDSRAFVCANKTSGKKCAACDERARMARDPDTDPDALKALKPKQRELFCVHDPDESEKGLQLFEVPNFFFGQQLKDAIEAADESVGENFASLKKGKTLKVKVGVNNFAGITSFVADRIDFTKRDEPIEVDADDVPCLDDLIKPIDYDKLKKMLLAEEDDDDEDEDENEDADDEEESEDEDSDDDEDEDEKPAKKKKGKKPAKKKSSKDDEEEEDDDDEEAEDEDEDDEEGEEDDDSEDEDEEDEGSFSVGDEVKFTYKKKKYKGKVKRVKGDLLYVKCSGRSDPYIVDADDCEAVDSDEDDEEDEDE